MGSKAINSVTGKKLIDKRIEKFNMFSNMACQKLKIKMFSEI